MIGRDVQEVRVISGPVTSDALEKTKQTNRQTDIRTGGKQRTERT